MSLESADKWLISVAAPLWEPLIYEVPKHIDLKPRQIVEVPLGNRKSKGVAISPLKSDCVGAPKLLKSINQIIYDHWQIPLDYFNWAQWISQYYVYPLGLVLESLYPLDSKNLSKFSDDMNKKLSLNHYHLNRLTQNQETIFNSIKSFDHFSVHLIDGVTGSGKTEIYIHLFKEVIDKSQKGLFLLPEISLTPQMISRFLKAFGEKIAVLHSQLTARQKKIEWQKIQNESASILIGARSALFCTIPKLGLIIIDEEHDISFKQDTKLKYHTRTCALKLAELKNIPLVLGSATPSLESYYQVQQKKWHYYKLYHRPQSNQPVRIEFVDLKNQSNKYSQLPYWLSRHLFERMKEVLEKNKQVALFLNRRGYASILLCNLCGYIEECPNCAISLTLHKNQMMVCHYCNYQASIRENCPSCREGILKPYGLGTEQVESDLKHLFPQYEILRIDRDQIKNIRDLEHSLKIFESQKVKILIGTQMISKGLDFPHLKLVGFILADLGMYMPDFRATERSCQILFQMSGRAGRHSNSLEDQGEIIIQTYRPENPIFKFLLNHNYEDFLNQESQNRKELGYPPYNRMVLFQVENKNLASVQKDIYFCEYLLKKGLEQIKRPYFLRLLGPAEAPISRMRGKFRFQMIIIVSRDVPISQIGAWVLKEFKRQKRSSLLHVDVDPYHLL